MRVASPEAGEEKGRKVVGLLPDHRLAKASDGDPVTSTEDETGAGGFRHAGIATVPVDLEALGIALVDVVAGDEGERFSGGIVEVGDETGDEPGRKSGDLVLVFGLDEFGDGVGKSSHELSSFEEWLV